MVITRNGQTVTFGEIEGFSESINTLLASEDGVLVSSLQALGADFGEQLSGVSQTLQAVADEQGATADAVQTVQTTIGDSFTEVNTVSSSVDAIKGVHAVKINNNGTIRGYGLVSEIIDGDPISDFVMDVDRVFLGTSSDDPNDFKVAFSIVDGVAYIEDLEVKEGRIKTLMLGNNAATAADFGQVSNNSAGQGMGTEINGPSADIEIPPNVTAKILISVNYQQGYLAQPRLWGYKIVGLLDLNTLNILTRTNMEATNDQACVTHLITITNNTNSAKDLIVFGNWYGEDSDIVLQKATISIFAGWK